MAPNELGAWSDANLAATVSEHIGVGSDDDVPHEIRFVSGVVKMIRNRQAYSTKLDLSDPLSPAVFLLAAEPPGAVVAATKRVPMADNGQTQLAGRLWFMSAPSVSGRFIDLPTGDDDTLFQLVARDLNLGTVPAIVLDPRGVAIEVRWYPNGLGSPDGYEPKSLTSADVSPERIYSVIDRMHEQCLITPEAQVIAGQLWADKDRHWPTSSAEAVVQLHVKVALVAAFPSCVVRHEQTQPEGRDDLEIEEYDPAVPGLVTRHAILELKVLRSYGSSGSSISETFTRKWISKGVSQAASYRNSKGARFSSLCCFDMRVHDMGNSGCFTGVKRRAAKLTVHLWRWYLYGSSEQLRTAATIS